MSNLWGYKYKELVKALKELSNLWGYKYKELVKASNRDAYFKALKTTWRKNQQQNVRVVKKNVVYTEVCINIKRTARLKCFGRVVSHVIKHLSRR